MEIRNWEIGIPANFPISNFPISNFKYMPKLFILFTLVVAVAIPCIAFGEKPTASVQKIYDALYQAAGQFTVKKPSLEISTENKRGAAYYSAKNAVVLDEKTYQLCRGMGKDSSAALAFVLAHELSHAFHRESKKNRAGTNYLSYDQTFEMDIQSEKVADINGVFTAYLAGYRLSQVVPKFLPKLYDAYGLTGRTLKGYPSLDERTRTTKEVLAITDDLIDLYEMGNYLLAIGRYDLAAMNYEYILEYYQGREIHNNLGVLYLSQAMENYLPVTDRFIYPIELDAATQLKKIAQVRGPQELTLQQKLDRMNLLNKALNKFMQAIALDKDYLTAKLNYACTLNLLQKPKNAVTYLAKRKLVKKEAKETANAEKIKLVLAISDALLGNSVAAKTGFREVAKSKTQAAAAAADYNLEVLQDKLPVAAKTREFVFPERFSILVKGMKVPKVSHLQPLNLNEQGDCVRHLTEGNTETFTFGNKRGNTLSIIRFKNTLATEIDLLELAEPLDRSFFSNLVGTPNGFYLKSEDGTIVLKVSNDGKVEEVVKVDRH